MGRTGRAQVAGQDLLDPVAQHLPGFVTGKLDTDTLGFVPLGAGRRDPGDVPATGCLVGSSMICRSMKISSPSLYSRVVGTKIPPFLMNGM
jgi:hypothetical protein